MENIVNTKVNSMINALVAQVQSMNHTYIPSVVTIKRDARGNVMVSYRVVQFIPVDKD